MWQMTECVYHDVLVLPHTDMSPSISVASCTCVSVIINGELYFTFSASSSLPKVIRVAPSSRQRSPTWKPVTPATAVPIYMEEKLCNNMRCRSYCEHNNSCWSEPHSNEKSVRWTTYDKWPVKTKMQLNSFRLITNNGKQWISLKTFMEDLQHKIPDIFSVAIAYRLSNGGLLCSKAVYSISNFILGICAIKTFTTGAFQ